MIEVTDEMLSQYVDGALDAETARAVEAYLERDAEAREYVAALRSVNQMSPDAMDAILGPPPQALIDSILKAPAGRLAPGQPASHASGNVVTFNPRAKRSTPSRAPQTQRFYAMAAALTLVVTAAAAYTWLPRTGNGPSSGQTLAAGPIAADSPLSSLLEREATGAGVDVAVAGQALRATLATTFKDGAGRFCRELEVAPAQQQDQASSASIACRSGDAKWSVEGSVAIAAADDATNGYVPSGSKDDDPLAPLMRKLDAGRALSNDEETAALTSQWRR